MSDLKQSALAVAIGLIEAGMEASADAGALGSTAASLSSAPGVPSVTASTASAQPVKDAAALEDELPYGVRFLGEIPRMMR